MRVNAKLGMLAAAGALAAAVPAVAKTHPSHPSKPSHPSHPSKSHKCAAHKVAYVASGELLTWNGTSDGKGGFTGTVVVTVKRANHHAKSSKGTAVTFTLDGAKVVLRKGISTPSTRDHVRVVGKITTVAKKCSDNSGAGVVTVRKITISVTHHHS